MRSLRIVAILAVRNERRYIAPQLRHLVEQGLEVYLLDDASTDDTVRLAEPFLGRGLIAIESMERDGVFRWARVLAHKERVAASLDADWFLHLDPDEWRLPPAPGSTLAEAIGRADAEGYNAVEFREFVFLPTREHPDHDHPHFRATMRWYYPFHPRPHQRLNAWKRQPGPVDLQSLAGHEVLFPGRRPYPRPFVMRHYVFLSVAHAIETYVHRRYDPDELARGWHVTRAQLRPETIRLPGERDLRIERPGVPLDASDPRTTHYVFDTV